MAYEQRELSGSLFKNERKTEENHPNATGSALIDGVEYWVSAWTKIDKNGNRWQSLAFKRKDQPAESPRQKAERSVRDIDQDIPFAPIGRSHVI